MLLLDIRSRSEYCAGHICGAVHIETPLPPFSTLELRRLKEQLQQVTQGLPKGTPINLYCKKGIRSQMAERILHRLGFRNALSLGGVHSSAQPFWLNLRHYSTCYCPR